MPFEVSGVYELLLTRFALKIPGSMVQHMKLQSVVAIERLSALVAFEQFLFRVYNLGMLREVAFKAEGHIALIALESFRRGMLRSLVFGEGLLRFKLLRAPVALGYYRSRR